MHELSDAIVLCAEVSLVTPTIAIHMHSRYALSLSAQYIKLSFYSSGTIKYHPYDNLVLEIYFNELSTGNIFLYVIFFTYSVKCHYYAVQYSEMLHR